MGSDDFEKIFDKRLERKIKKAEAEAHKDIFATIPDSPILFKARRKAVRSFLRNLEQDFKRFKADCANKYKDELKPDTDKFPRKGMENQVKIMANMERKGNRLFFPLINALCRISLDKKQSEKLMDTINIPLAEVVTVDKKTKMETLKKYSYVLLPALTNDVMENLAESLEASKEVIFLYLKEMAWHGIIRELVRTGKGGARLYAIGYFTSFPDNKFRKNWFLKNSPEMKTALRKFRAYEEKKLSKINFL